MTGNTALLNELISTFIPSPCYGTRHGNDVRLAAFHTTEGSRTVESLGGWFGVKARQVSSHCGVDDYKVARFVPESMSSWAAGNANPHCTQIEICAFARWSVSEWEKHPQMLELLARWAAAVSVYHSIPLVRVRGTDTMTGRGFTMHVDLTKGYGGTHQDCGPAFRDVIFDRILARARQILSGAPDSHISPPNIEEDDDMKLTDAIRNANPFGNKDTPMSNIGNVLQDIQANAATAARTIATLPSFIADVRNVLADIVRRLDALEKK